VAEAGSNRGELVTELVEALNRFGAAGVDVSGDVVGCGVSPRRCRSSHTGHRAAVTASRVAVSCAMSVHPLLMGRPDPGTPTRVAGVTNVDRGCDEFSTEAAC
jgi:hypothetical protein